MLLSVFLSLSASLLSGCHGIVAKCAIVLILLFVIILEIGGFAVFFVFF